MTKIERLTKIALGIPTMCGPEAGEILKTLASDAGGTIVEVGAWLGGMTAWLAMGLIDAKKKSAIHVYDRFEASASEVGKAMAVHYKLHNHQDTLPLVKENLAEFGDRFEFHKGDIGASQWDGGEIAMYVDDASKRPKNWNHAIDTFFPSFYRGTIMVLLDYFYFEKNPDPDYLCQKKFMEKRPDQFHFIDRVPGTSGAVFRVL